MPQYQIIISIICQYKTCYKHTFIVFIGFGGFGTGTTGFGTTATNTGFGTGATNTFGGTGTFGATAAATGPGKFIVLR